MTATGVGPTTLRRAVRRSVEWREHRGLDLVLVHREPGEEPLPFDGADLGRLADIGRVR